MSDPGVIHNMRLAPVDQAFCMAVGYTIIQWGQLDRTYHDFISRLHKANEAIEPEHWRTGLRPKQKAGMLSDLANRYFSAHPRIIKELEDIKSAMEASQIDRNLFAHGEIATIPPHQELPVMQIRCRGRYRGTDYERFYTVQLIQEIYSFLGNLHGRLTNLTSDQISAWHFPKWSEQELSALQNFRDCTR